MSKEYNESLLPKSPPSPLKDNKWLDVASSNTKKIIIHYWSEYDEGLHKFHEIEITNTHRVLDVIILSIQQFEPSAIDPGQFYLRIADKSGKPKTSMPTLDVGQGIFDIGIVRFALCSKLLDARRSEKFEKFEDQSPTEIKEPPAFLTNQSDNKVVTLEQRGKSGRRKICCCFYSED